MPTLWESVAQSLTMREIMNQPASWAATLELDAATLAAVAPEEEELVFTGCGSSYYLARAAASLAREALGAPAIAVPASDVALAARQVFTRRRTRLVAFSRSGETSETVAACRAAGAHGTTVAVTCAAGSALSAVADRSVNLPHAGDESVVMTQSFTNMLLAVMAGCAHAAGDADRLAELRMLPDSVHAGLQKWQIAAEATARDESWSQAFFFGTGAYYGLACEASLKLKEMTQAVTEAYHPLEFRHGPQSVLTDRTLCVLLRREESGGPEDELMAHVRERGARTVTLAPGQADFQLESGFGDWARAPLYLPPLQLFAVARTAVAGLDPDRPRGLTRVVRLPGEVHG